MPVLRFALKYCHVYTEAVIALTLCMLIKGLTLVLAGRSPPTTPKTGEKRKISSSFSDDEGLAAEVSKFTDRSMDTSRDDYSMSSDESFKDSDGFCIPR